MISAAELKKTLTVEQIVDIVSNGLEAGECYYDNRGNPIFRTICHNPPGEGKHKLYYYQDSQTFFCFTECNCSFDIFELIQKAGKAQNFIDAYYFVRQFAPDSSLDLDIEPEVSLTIDWELLHKINFLKKKEIENSQKELKPIPENIINYFSPIVPTKWLQEGISAEAMQLYNIRMDLANERIIIPHYSIEGDLVGIRARTFNEEELAQGRKYSPIYIQNVLYNHPLGENLYGLNISKEAIKKFKKAVIFEGEKSCLLAQTYYGENNFTVAVCGSTISDSQVKLLLNLGVTEIIIAFDKENDDFIGSDLSLKYQAKLEKLAAKFSPYVNTYYVFDIYKKLDYKDSPIDKGQETLEFLLKHKKLVPSFTIDMKNARRNKT